MELIEENHAHHVLHVHGTQSHLGHQRSHKYVVDQTEGVHSHHDLLLCDFHWHSARADLYQMVVLELHTPDR